MQRHAIAVWHGSLKEGSGTITTESQSLYDVPYSFTTRFENQVGSNPEELIAAAHAACFTMAFSGELQKANLTARTIRTFANVELGKTDEQWSITKVHLDMSANVPGATEEQFLKAAETAKKNCPVSRLLKAEITISAKLDGVTLSAETEQVSQSLREASEDSVAQDSVAQKSGGAERETEAQTNVTEDPLQRSAAANGSEVPGPQVIKKEKPKGSPLSA